LREFGDKAAQTYAQECIATEITLELASITIGIQTRCSKNERSGDNAAGPDIFRLKR